MQDNENNPANGVPPPLQGNPEAGNGGQNNPLALLNQYLETLINLLPAINVLSSDIMAIELPVNQLTRVMEIMSGLFGGVFLGATDMMTHVGVLFLNAEEMRAMRDIRRPVVMVVDMEVRRMLLVRIGAHIFNPILRAMLNNTDEASGTIEEDNATE